MEIQFKFMNCWYKKVLTQIYWSALKTEVWTMQVQCTDYSVETQMFSVEFNNFLFLLRNVDIDFFFFASFYLNQLRGEYTLCIKTLNRPSHGSDLARMKFHKGTHACVQHAGQGTESDPYSRSLVSLLVTYPLPGLTAARISNTVV